MQLPPEIHRMLFDYLDSLDRLCMLLTCKYFTRVGSAINTEDNSVRVGLDLMRINGGLSDRMPKRLNLCTKCGVMRPRDPTYWEPHRCRWSWRKLIPSNDYRRFADGVHAWSAGRVSDCPRCFGHFLAQGNVHVADPLRYGS
jgi:hypothetical protein